MGLVVLPEKHDRVLVCFLSLKLSWVLCCSEKTSLLQVFHKNPDRVPELLITDMK